MTTKDIIINRDTDNDVLYVIKTGIDKSKTINVIATADILLRLDPDTHRVVGLTIEDFSEIFPDIKDDSDYLLMEHFDNLIELLNASHSAINKIS